MRGQTNLLINFTIPKENSNAFYKTIFLSINGARNIFYANANEINKFSLLIWRTRAQNDPFSCLPKSAHTPHTYNPKLI